MGAGASSVPGEVCLATMLRYSHSGWHGQAPSLRRWPGSWRNTLSHCNQVRTFSLMLGGSRKHCKPIAIGNRKAQNSCFTCTYSFVAPANYNWYQLMACEIWSAGEHCCRTCGGCVRRSPWALISPSAFWIPIWAPLRTPEAVARVAVFCMVNILPNVCSPMTSGAHQPARTRLWNCAIHRAEVQHMGAGASWVKG